jgi:hypothetical protein
MGGVSLPFIGSGVVRRRDHGGEPVGHGGFHGGQLRKKEEEAVGDRFRKWKMRGQARLGSALWEATRWPVAALCSGAAAENRVAVARC